MDSDIIRIATGIRIHSMVRPDISFRTGKNHYLAQNLDGTCTMAYII
ncbi:MAG: hypothetical protein U9R75_03720 [Candidatus Thermoplasmatota archaeon]|nr:hypothetical protein [Candidatus Thermoplasmatota archaeon]